MCNDLAAVGIHRQVQFSPATPGLCPTLFFQPLARAMDFQPGAVDQNVQGSSATCCRSVLLVDGFQVLALRLSVV